MNVLIAINESVTGKIPPGDPRWATFNDQFRPREMEPIDIANEIYSGHAYSGIHAGRRSLENFVSAQHIAVDLDSGDQRSALSTLERHVYVRMFGGLLHTTPSHTAAAPRARVIFFLDRPITDAGGYQSAARYLAAQFDGSDPACTDASRFFYGSLGCNIWVSDNVLPVAQLRHDVRRWNALQRPAPGPRDESPDGDAGPPQNPGFGGSAPPVRGGGGGVNMGALLNPIRMAQPGNRNNALNRQSFLAGRDVRAGKLTHSAAIEHLLGAALAVGLDEREALATIHSGLRGGSGTRPGRGGM